MSVIFYAECKCGGVFQMEAKTSCGQRNARSWLGYWKSIHNRGPGEPNVPGHKITTCGRIILHGIKPEQLDGLMASQKKRQSKLEKLMQSCRFREKFILLHKEKAT